jgi:hypothetical protein
MCLGPAWLDGVLAAEGLVFLGNAEARLTSGLGFETMGKMNPQARARLRDVAEPQPLGAAWCGIRWSRPF